MRMRGLFTHWRPSGTGGRQCGIIIRRGLPPEALAEVERLALTAYRLLSCRDFARMDFRLDKAGRPHFLECNALPGLNPQSSDFVILGDVASYASLVQGILLDAARRQGVRIA